MLEIFGTNVSASGNHLVRRNRVFGPVGKFTVECRHRDNDTVLVVRNWKIRIIGNESESDSDVPLDSNNSEWTSCEESIEIPPMIKFIAGKKFTGPQVSTNVEQPLNFLKIFSADELINQITIERNNCAAKMEGGGQTLSSHSIWHNVTKEEFLPNHFVYWTIRGETRSRESTSTEVVNSRYD